MKKILILFWTMANGINIIAQGDFTSLNDVLTKYPFINGDSSIIHNEKSLYSNFFPSLEKLSNERNRHVVIAHIGDSHIQAGYITAPIRMNLQMNFGNAGRGLIFPYRVAKTNSPEDYNTYSNDSWISKRNSYSVNSLPTGIMGYSIYSTNPLAYIDLNLKKKDIDTSIVTILTIIHNPIADSNFSYRITDTNGFNIGTLVNENNHSKFTSKYTIDGNPSRIRIHQDKITDNQKGSIIYGIVLQNESAGILYHSIGVNGAEYKSYLKSEYFGDQISELNPDLVIISLGTNEAFNFTDFNASVFIKNVDSLILSIKSKSNKTDILISIPSESYKKIRTKHSSHYGENPLVETIKELLIDYANSHQIAYWNLYDVMGGKGSISKWAASGMTDSRRVHFTKEGYNIQGMLFYRALMDSYYSYLIKKK